MVMSHNSSGNIFVKLKQKYNIYSAWIAVDRTYLSLVQKCWYDKTSDGPYDAVCKVGHMSEWMQENLTWLIFLNCKTNKTIDKETLYKKLTVWSKKYPWDYLLMFNTGFVKHLPHITIKSLTISSNQNYVGQKRHKRGFNYKLS